MTYTAEMVEKLVPAIWDDFAYGMPREEVPDPTMPKAKANPAHGNTLYAMMADIRTAWKGADLSLVERQALLLRFGMDWTLEDVAFNQGLATKWSAQKRTERGVAKLLAFLNGKTWHAYEDAVQVGDE